MDAKTATLIKSHNELKAMLRRHVAEPFETLGTREFRKLLPTRNRACAACGLKRKADGHDPCLGHLPGVSNACCGHGVQNGYIQFENGITIRGVFHTEHGFGPGNLNHNHNNQ